MKTALAVENVWMPVQNKDLISLEKEKKNQQLFIVKMRNVKYKTSLFLLFIAISFSAFSQQDCRSHVGAHLTPFAKNFPLLWAVEGTLSHGLMDDRQITNGFLFVGLDYTKKKHQLYVEGGYKGWRNSLGFPENGDFGDNYIGLGFFQKNRLGMREVIYRFQGNKTSAIFGLHSMKSTDLFLVNERAIGTSINHKMGALSLDVNAGTVTRDFARMGNFCGVRYLYNTTHKTNEILPGKRVFPVCYETARSMVQTAGENVGVRVRPHDLRRHAATFASRSGVPIEIVKSHPPPCEPVTTQIYLGEVSDIEALRWIENIYA